MDQSGPIPANLDQSLPNWINVTNLDKSRPVSINIDQSLPICTNFALFFDQIYAFKILCEIV